MPRHKQRERDQVMSDTRRRLLDAATAEFAREGYNGANIDHISRAAGFAKGTIYNYFPSKRALMLSLIDSITAEHYQTIAAPVRQEQDAVRRLERFFQVGAEWIVDNLAEGQVMLTMLHGPDAEFKARMAQGYEPMHQLIVDEILVPGIEQGLFRPVDLAGAAGLLMTLYLGIGSTVDEQGKARLASEWIAEFVMNGLRRPE